MMDGTSYHCMAHTAWHTLHGTSCMALAATRPGTLVYITSVIQYTRLHIFRHLYTRPNTLNKRWFTKILQSAQELLFGV